MLPRGFDRFHRVPCGWTFGIKRGRQKRLPAVFRRDCRPGLVEALERARAVLGAKGSVFFYSGGKGKGTRGVLGTIAGCPMRTIGVVS
jgi:hypothetical protein